MTRTLTPAENVEKGRLDEAPKPTSSDRVITFTLAASGLIAAFMQTVVTPIIPQLPTLLQTNAVDATWVLTATLLAAAVTTPISGRLGDMYGKRRIALALLLLTLLGSIVCAMSNTLVPMVVGRSLQGVGLGVVALGVSILRDVIHNKSLGRAVALVSATLGVGGAVGLPAAAWIAQTFDFHVLFWFSASLTLVAVALMWTFIPRSTVRSGGRFDVIGSAGFAIGMVAVLLGLSKGAAWGWDSPATLGLLIGGPTVLVVWGFIELRSSHPLIDLRIAVRRPVLFTNLGSISIGFAFFTVSATLPVLLESPTSSGVGMGQTMLAASLYLMPLGLVMFFIAPLAARLSAARGARTSLAVGAVILTIGFALAAFLHSQPWEVLLLAVFAGIGVGFAYAAMPTLIMQSVPVTETAAANGLNSVMRTFGSSLASAIIGLVLVAQVTITNGISVPTTEGFRSVYLIAAAVALIGTMLFVAIPRPAKVK